jgi:hypothetical protein
LSSEFRKTDVEIAVVSAENPEVHILTPDEIEVELNKIGESD